MVTAPNAHEDSARMLSGNPELNSITKVCYTGNTVQNTQVIQKLWSQIKKARISFERPADSMAPT